MYSIPNTLVNVDCRVSSFFTCLVSGLIFYQRESKSWLRERPNIYSREWKALPFKVE